MGQGGVLQVQEEPQEGPEARCEEVVLCSHRRVRPCLSNKMHRQVEATIPLKGLFCGNHQSFGSVHHEKSNKHCHRTKIEPFPRFQCDKKKRLVVKKVIKLVQ